MISAGEASGDLHGANLIRSMRRQRDNLFFCGIGGAAMREAGAKIIVEADQLSVVGITEVLARLPAILEGLAAAKKVLLSRVPDILILIDFPDFNFKLAAVAKQQGIPVFYYITPQVWAWRQRRVYTIKRLVDRAAVILPFEENFFRRHGIPVSFVGHPLLDSGYAQLPAPVETSLQTGTPVVGFLPGSRTREVRKLLPLMLDSAIAINSRLNKVRFLVSCASSVPAEVFDEIAGRFSGRVDFEVVTGKVDAILNQATMVVAASGTVALEAAQLPEKLCREHHDVLGPAFFPSRHFSPSPHSERAARRFTVSFTRTPSPSRRRKRSAVRSKRTRQSGPNSSSPRHR